MRGATDLPPNVATLGDTLTWTNGPQMEGRPWSTEPQLLGNKSYTSNSLKEIYREM